MQKFDVNGGYLLQFAGMDLVKVATLLEPLGVITHGDGVLIADQCNHRVLVFHRDGWFRHTIGSGQLNQPFDVAVTKNNKMLVADLIHH